MKRKNEIKQELDQLAQSPDLVLREPVKTSIIQVVSRLAVSGACKNVQKNSNDYKDEFFH